MRVAITGADGLLGHAVLPALAGAGHDTLSLDLPDTDVTRYDTLLARLEPFRPDWVFHLAAFTHVDRCESEPDTAFLVNGLGARNAALAAARLGAAVLAISTDYVFGGTATQPLRPYDAVAPLGVYGRSKWAGEQAVREVNARHLVARTAWLFGAGGANFVDTIVARAAAGQPLAVVDDQRGSPTYTPDLAAQLVRLAERAQYGTYHVTNSGECTWHELAAYAVKRGGHAVEVERLSTRQLGRPAPRPAYSVLDNGWTEHVTGQRLPHWQDAVDRHLATVGNSAAGTTPAGRE